MFILLGLLPFSIAIAPGFTYTVMGLLAASYLTGSFIRKKTPLVFTSLNLPILGLFLTGFLSFWNSLNLPESVHGIVRLAQNVFLMWIFIASIKTKKQLFSVVIGMFVGAFLASSDAMWQLVTGKDFVRGNELILNIGLNRATAAFPNANVFGVYLGMLAPVVLGLSLFYFKGKTRLFLGLICAVVTAGIISTFSRGTGIGFYCAVMFIVILKKQWKLLIALLILLAAFWFIMPKNIKEWARSINYNPVVFLLNADRISIYRNSLNMIEHHPFVGVGINTFSSNYLTYKLPEAEGAKTSDHMYAHNNFLQMAGETGLLGLSAFIWFLIVMFLKAGFIIKNSRDLFCKTLAISLTASLIAFLINGMTETSFYYARVAMLFWVCIGVLLSLEKFIQVDPKKIKKILVIRNDRLGEFLLTVPAIAALKKEFNASITAVVHPHVRVLAEKVPEINQVMSFSPQECSLSEKIKFMRMIRDEKFDLAIVFNSNKTIHWLIWFAGIYWRLGYGRKSGFLLNKTLSDFKHINGNHEVRNNIELLSVIGLKNAKEYYTLRLDNELVQSTLSHYSLEPGYIVVHPFTSDARKQWPLDNFKSLIQDIHNTLNKTVVIVGSPELYNNQSLVLDNCPGVVDLVSKIDILHLGAIIQASSLVVSGDSGPVHLAAIENIKTVVLFRNDLVGKGPKRWGPWGNTNIVIAKPSLDLISVQEVFDSVKKILKD